MSIRHQHYNEIRLLYTRSRLPAEALVALFSLCPHTPRQRITAATLAELDLRLRRVATGERRRRQVATGVTNGQRRRTRRRLGQLRPREREREREHSILADEQGTLNGIHVSLSVCPSVRPSSARAILRVCSN